MVVDHRRKSVRCRWRYDRDDFVFVIVHWKRLGVQPCSIECHCSPSRWPHLLSSAISNAIDKKFRFSVRTLEDDNRRRVTVDGMASLSGSTRISFEWTIHEYVIQCIGCIRLYTGWIEIFQWNGFGSRLVGRKVDRSENENWFTCVLRSTISKDRSTTYKEHGLLMKLWVCSFWRSLLTTSAE